MLTRRLIACLDVRDGQVVKGVNFEGLRLAGNPAELARRYNADGIDELVLLDVTATLEGRRTFLDTVRAVAGELFIPLSVGGGIGSLDAAKAVFDAGADKVSVNSAALKTPQLITDIANVYGSQAVIVAIDAADAVRSPQSAVRGPWSVHSRSGTQREDRDAVSWAREAEERGAGEILLTSIDRDGTKSGFDCDLTAAVSTAVNIPVIASGGAGTFEHFAEVFTAGRADAALAASVFHFSEHAVSELKAFLAERRIPMRPAPTTTPS
jgi:cyclase